MAAYIDFNRIKEEHGIEQIAAMLNLQLRRNGSQLRGACPSCQAGGDRALAINLQKQAFFCFGEGKGGDSIALVSHVKGVPPRQAAELIVNHFGEPHRSSTPPPAPAGQKPAGVGEGGEREFSALTYLESAHEAVEALGLHPDTAQALGIGYASKGLMRGTIAVPIRLEDGTLAGYIGVTDCVLPSKWHIPNTNVVRLKRGTHGN